MTRFKQGVVAILLSTSLVLTAAEAYAKPPAVCGFVGCSVGPDNCMTIHVGIAFVELSMTCYTRMSTAN
jgi:hypothetical protein